MSLTSFLLSSSAPVDAGLDSLFKSTAHASVSNPIPGPSKESPKKRKVQVEDAHISSKRAKPSPQTPSETSKIIVQYDQKSDQAAKPRKKNGKRDKVKQRAKEPVAEGEGEDNLETPHLRDQRTIFVGNLPIELASKKPLSKQLRRHILAFVPTAKIDSVRFRSIPFQTPTSKLPTSDNDTDSTRSKLKPQIPKKETSRLHDRERASVWRSKAVDKDEVAVQQDEKIYITSGQKKKIAFINQEFHSTADTVNAYIVFAHPVNTEDRPSNLPPIPPTLDPYEAARLAAETCDGTLFMERMIRVDLVRKNNERGSTVTKDFEQKSASIGTDPKLSVFVGNLDFASKEEDLRGFFEGLMVSEKGLPPTHDDTDEGGQRKPLTWVTRVRIVRDKDTYLGKGFAYVQFSDRACVDELLALEETKLKFAKRKLRVQRCKTLSGSKFPVTAAPKSKGQAPAAIVIPKGDPSLGEKLAGLSKDERKQHKSTDADRVARRLAKKKARMALAPAVGIVKSQGKDRKRVRKTTGGRKPSGKDRGRIRSTASVAKKKNKK